MLVVISDLHLNDEGNRTIAPRAFEIFRERVIENARKIDWGDPGSPGAIPADERFVDIVLNGDILDYIRSERWQDNPQKRPWESLETYGKVLSEINDGILDKNKESLAILKSLSSGTGLPADFPANVRFRIHYLAGNHDWFLVLPKSTAANALRKKVIKAIGLHPETNTIQAPFPHDPLTAGCADLLRSLRRHRVFVRHGDVHDPMNYPGKRDRASIGDAIVIEILGAIAPATRKKIQGHVKKETLELTISYLRELDNLRPYSALPRWLESLLATIEETPTLREDAPLVTRAINDTFKELATNFRTLDFVRAYPGVWERAKAKLPTYVSAWLGIRLPALQESVMHFALSRGTNPEKYAKAAYGEQWLRQGIADTVVYGHTHNPEVVPLDMVRLPLDSGDDAREWTYVNSGTWRPVQQCCHMQDSQNEFSFSHTMTHVTFYTKRERPDHTIDFWTGSLSDTHFPVHADRDLLLLHGRLVERATGTSTGLPGEPKDYRIELYDRDLTRDDHLGTVIPDPDWAFAFGFFQNEFRETGEGAFPEPRLDVYREGVQVASVKVDWPPYAGRSANLGDIGI